jgi:hypothetical protein
MKNTMPLLQGGNQTTPSSLAPRCRSHDKLSWRSAWPLLFLCAALLAHPCAATPGQWDFTGSLNTARDHHTATLLSDGKVLVAGGFDTSAIASAELYDPVNGTWNFTGNLNTARSNHTATLLSNGMVLVAGGAGTSAVLSSAELYDPASGTWTATGNLRNARSNHTAILLPDGKVLVAGGLSSGGAPLASAELYDPATGTWSLTGSLNIARWDTVGMPSTLLPDGTVLVEGGVVAHSVATGTAEVYDSISGTWSVKGSLNTARYDHTATLLPNGLVLAAGGDDSNFVSTASGELYDPATGVWTATGSMVQDRSRHTATLLSNGFVLVAGGVSTFDGFLTEAELYDPATGTWTVTGSMNDARADYPATLLPSGQVLVAAGGVPNAVNSAELYDSGIAITLSAAGRKVGGINTVRLNWSGATSPNIDVNRDGVVIATVPNTGKYNDSTGTTGRATFTYTVCEAGTQTCSNEVTVRFRR